MSELNRTLVKWEAIAGLGSGWIPINLKADDFENVDTDSVKSHYVATYLGDPETMGQFGLTAYEYPEPKVYSPKNYVVNFDGTKAIGLGSTYYGEEGVPMTLTANIVDDLGDKQSWIDATELGYPPILKMPITKHVGGSGGIIVDEVYLTTTLVKGVLTASGKLPSSGDWKLSSERLNQALSAINAGWSIKDLNINILV